MPRTKAPKKIKQENSDNSALVENYLKILDIQENILLKKLQTIHKDFLYKLDRLRAIEVNKVIQVQFEQTTLCMSTTNNQSTAKSTRRPTRRSNNDEGYLTAESRSMSSERGARVTATAKKRVTRQSRSLSRSNEIKTAPKTAYKTPMNRKIPDIKVITPKVQMNAPQMLLRRPKQGEKAVSMQGSPLMVSSLADDTQCTVNIPLGDGFVCALQPQQGPIRLSMLPEMDMSVQAQLHKLRDNLNKLCEAVSGPK